MITIRNRIEHVIFGDGMCISEEAKYLESDHSGSESAKSILIIGISDEIQRNEIVSNIDKAEQYTIACSCKKDLRMWLEHIDVLKPVELILSDDLLEETTELISKLFENVPINPKITTVPSLILQTNQSTESPDSSVHHSFFDHIKSDLNARIGSFYPRK